MERSGKKQKKKKEFHVFHNTLLHMGSCSRTPNSNSNIPVLVRSKIAMLRLAEKKIKNVFLYCEIGPSAMAPNDSHPPIIQSNSVHSEFTNCTLKTLLS